MVALRLGIAICSACLLVTAVSAGAASTRPPSATVLVVTGRGWGHGLGMSQWGARGYALHGWSYQRILAHYYPGTVLGRVGQPRVRVLLLQGDRIVTIGCPSAMKVSDSTGIYRQLAAGTYGVSSKLVFPVRRVTVRDGRQAKPVVHTLGRQLSPPVVVQCPHDPLLLDGRAYHGDLVLRRSGSTLSVVSSLPLEAYVRDVVGAEMPNGWSPAALEAQAVAARSYAVAELRPGEPFDLYPDDRNQTYGGVRAESPSTDAAVAKTSGQVLMWDGRVATTYYSTSSGGRTADIRDLDPGAAPVPYLRPVPDPYDAASPHHVWQPVSFTPEELGARLGAGGAVSSVRIVRGPGGRATEVDVGLVSGSVEQLTGKRVAQALRLRSTWFFVGELTLSASSGRVVYGHPVRLLASDSSAPATIEQKVGGGPWTTLRGLRIRTQLAVEPRAATLFRVVEPGVTGPAIAVSVAPRVKVRPLSPTLLGGTIEPVPTAAVTLWRYARTGWALVARPRPDAQGVFRTHLRLRAGGYRVSVAGDSHLAATEVRIVVSKRLLASLRGR